MQEISHLTPPSTRRRQNQKREKSNLRKGIIIDRPIAAACQSWQGYNSYLVDGSTDWVAISEEAGLVKRRRASVARRSCRGEGVTIGDRDEKWREIEGRW